MKRIISLLGIVFILFLAVGCQSKKNVEKDWNLIYIQEIVDDYNRIVIEISKKEGLDDPDLLTLSKEAEKISGDKYKAVGTFNGAKYPKMFVVISSEKFMSLTLTFKEGDIATPYNEKLAKIACTAAIETIKPGQGLEIERELQLVDENGNFCLPLYKENPDESNLKSFFKDDFYFSFANMENKGIDITIDPKK